MKKSKYMGVEVNRYTLTERFNMALKLISSPGYTPDYTIAQLYNEVKK